MLPALTEWTPPPGNEDKASLKATLRPMRSLGLPPRRRIAQAQCLCRLRPPQQQPQEPDEVEQAGASPPSVPPPADANTESFLVKRVDPQQGHGVPFHLLDRTRISVSFPHFPQ
jgi:hypothetical protein